MRAINKNPSPRELRTFGLIMLAGFCILGGLFWFSGRLPGTWCGWSGSGRQCTGIVLFLVGAACAACSASPSVGRLLYVGWMTVGMYLGMVMTTVMLTLMFFLLLPVFSLIRLADPLRLKLRKTGSYWEDHKPHEATLERTARPF
jgi:hypothetical protein